MTETLRKPAIFSVDDPRLVIAKPDEAPRPAAATVVTAPELSTDLVAVPIPAKRRFAWGALFWSALSGLVLLALGLAVTNLVEDLYARAPWLGAVGLALALLAGLALLVVMLREIIGLARLSTVEALRERALTIIETDDRDRGRALIADMLSLTRRIPRLARARARLEEHCADIIDGRDLVRLAERELMSPLDIEARRLVVAASKRVSVVTAISPRAAVDMIFVLVNALAPHSQARRAVWRPAGRAGRAEAAPAGCVASGGDRRRGLDRQRGAAGDRPWHRGATVGPARRGHGQWSADRSAGPPHHRPSAAIAVPRAAAAGAERPGRAPCCGRPNPGRRSTRFPTKANNRTKIRLFLASVGTCRYMQPISHADLAI